jgi:hypothetical protein
MISKTRNDPSFILDETPIYRYMTLAQFLFMVQHSCLYFSSISLWDDPFEGIDSKTFHEKYKYVIEREKSGQQWRPFTPMEREVYNYCELYSKYYSEFCYGTSWSLLNESDAMWRIYSSDTKGIKIQTTAGKLSSLHEFELGFPGGRHQQKFNSKTGKVIYTTENKPVEDTYLPLPTLEIFFYKRPEFEHEKEVRKVIEGFQIEALKEEVRTKLRVLQGKFIHAKIDLKDFIDEIVVDPRTPDWFLSTMERYCCGVSSLTGKFIGRSKLYSLR